MLQVIGRSYPEIKVVLLLPHPLQLFKLELVLGAESGAIWHFLSLLIDLHPHLFEQVLLSGWHSVHSFFVEAFDDGDYVQGLMVFIEDFIGSPVLDILNADEQNVVEGVSDVFGPVVEQLEEGVAQQKHGDLVATVLAEQIEVVVDDYEDPVDGVEVLSPHDGLDDGEEVVVVEAARETDCLVLGEAVEALVNDVESDLYVLKVMDVGLFADDGHEQVDEVFVSQHGESCLDESVGVVLRLLPLHLVQNHNH